MVKGKYFQTYKGNLEYEVRHGKNSKYYFSDDNKRFFGSKIKEDDVFVNDDKTKYLFKEKLNNAPPGGNNIKIAVFDTKKGKVENLYFGTSNAIANKVLKKQLGN